MQPVYISTVTPVYNGADYLNNLVQALDVYKQKLESNYKNLVLLESIFVIDECIDNSLEVLRLEQEKYNWVKVVELSRNYGQHPATIAGILHASGDWIVTLDEDLQHHPNYITSMLKQLLEQNCDVCYARSERSVHKSFVKDNLASLFKFIIAKLTNNKNIYLFNSYRVMRGQLARAAAAVSGPETYFDMALSWFTMRAATHEITLYDQRNANAESNSGYSFFGLVKHAKRMVMSSKLKFLRVGLIIGALVSLFSLFYGLSIFIKRLYLQESIGVQGWASIIVMVSIFGGISSLMLGVLIESVSDILMKTKGQPTFFVVDRSQDKALLASLKDNEDI